MSEDTATLEATLVGAYRSASNPLGAVANPATPERTLGAWLDELGATAGRFPSIPTTDAYVLFRAWCERAGAPLLSPYVFAHGMLARFPKRAIRLRGNICTVYMTNKRAADALRRLAKETPSLPADRALFSFAALRQKFTSRLPKADPCPPAPPPPVGPPPPRPRTAVGPLPPPPEPTPVWALAIIPTKRMGQPEYSVVAIKVCGDQVLETEVVPESNYPRVSEALADLGRCAVQIYRFGAVERMLAGKS